MRQKLSHGIQGCAVEVVCFSVCSPVGCAQIIHSSKKIEAMPLIINVKLVDALALTTGLRAIYKQRQIGYGRFN